jgi:heme oxygenase (mycobilin-producing)
VDRIGAGRVWSAPMYVSVSRLRVAQERVDELIAAFRHRAGLVDGFAGFIDLQVWRSDRDPGEVLMVSRWEDREHFKTYMKSREHQISHDRIDSELKASIRLERLEHLHTYEVVAQ